MRGFIEPAAKKTLTKIVSNYAYFSEDWVLNYTAPFCTRTMMVQSFYIEDGFDDCRAQDSAYRQFFQLNYESVDSYNNYQRNKNLQVPENSHFLKRLEARFVFNFEGGRTQQYTRAGFDNSQGDAST